MKFKIGIASVVFFTSILIIQCFFKQADFYVFFPILSLGFGAYIFLISYCKESQIAKLIALGILIRICLVFLFPNLSDDIYRFYWDGMMWQDGVNPLSYLPKDFLSSGLATDQRYQEIFGLLNSQAYFTIYPPLCQLIFFFSAFFDSVESASVFFKFIFLLSELLSIIGLMKILSALSLPRQYGLIYFLNPLIVIELTGNLHFEALMITGVIWMLYFLIKKRLILSGLCFGLAIIAKLVPLILGPALLYYLIRNFEKWWQFFVASGLVVCTTFGLMFYDTNVFNLLESINLYFQSFEFNASLYYIFRSVGYSLYGYNKIADYGPLLALTSLVIILFFSFRKSENMLELLKHMSFILIVYLLFATTVHPWYLSMLLLLALFNSKTKWLLVVWTYLVFLSYSAYDSVPVQEHMWALGIEYGVLFIFFILLYFFKTERADNLLNRN